MKAEAGGGASDLEVGDIAEIVRIKRDSEGYHLEFIDDFDERLENTIKELNKENRSINLSHVDSLKTFIMAEAMTKYPYLGGESEPQEGKFQGTIKIKRVTPDDEDGKLLKYVDPSTFDGYIESNDENALEVFTLNDKKELVTATGSYNNNNLSLQKNTAMNYRNVTSAYTMPFELPLFFLIDSDCEEFCVKFAELAMNSTMEISIVDDVVNTKVTKIVTTEVKTTEEYYETKQNDQGEYVNEKTGENTTTTYETSSPVVTEYADITSKILLTNVKSWAAKKECKLKLVSTEDTPIETSETGETTTTLPNGRGTHDATTTTYTTVRKTPTTNTKTEVTRNTFNVTESATQENTDDFIEIYREYNTKLKDNIIPEWIFEMMEHNNKTSNLIELVKYLLYKVNNKDYGVKNFKDLDFFNNILLNSVGQGTFNVTGNTITKEEFVKLSQDYYTGSSEYEEYLAKNAEAIYDICVKNGINPIYAYACACKETNFGSNKECIDKNNLFGIKNEDGDYKEYDSIEDSIEDFCEQNKDHTDTIVTGEDIEEVAKKIFGDKIYSVSISVDGNVQLVHDFTAQWENVYMYKYLYSNDYDNEYENNVFINNYVTKDKKYFICGEDIGTGNGTRNFGFGILHYTHAQSNNNYPNSFYNQENYKEVGINIEQEKYKQIGTTIEVEPVEKVALIIIGKNRQSVIDAAANNGVTLNDNEINALTDIAHQYGPGVIPNILKAYKKYGNTEEFKNNQWTYFNNPNGYNEPRSRARWDIFHNGIYKTSLDEIIDLSKYASTTILNGETAAEGKIIEETGDGYTKIYQSGNVKYKLYEQFAGSYCKNDYGSMKISSYGCGPSCVAILTSGYQPNVTPGTVVSECSSITANTGIGRWTAVQGYLNHYGFKYQDGGIWNTTINTNSKNEIINHLKSGNPVIMLVHGVVKTNSGQSKSYGSHYITLLGINSKNEVFVGDPGSSWNDSYTTMDNLINTASPDKYFLVSR